MLWSTTSSRDRFLLILLCLLISFEAVARTPWVLPYQRLTLKSGFDYSRSTQNFAFDGVREDFGFDYNRRFIPFELQYGIAENWETYLNTGFVSNSVTDTQGVALSGTGIPDATLGMKWLLIPGNTALSAEVFTKIPFISKIPPSTDSLVVGDGNFDLGLVGHFGHRAEAFRVTVSPGFLFRAGGYAPQLLMNTTAEVHLERVYALLDIDFKYSLGDELLLDSAIDVHDAQGTGGSYALLSGSPSLLTAGVGIGVKVIRELGVEARFTHALWGQRAPLFWTAGFRIVASLDFYSPVRMERIREVPLNP